MRLCAKFLKQLVRKQIQDCRISTSTIKSDQLNRVSHLQSSSSKYLRYKILSKMSKVDTSRFIIPNTVPICKLDCTVAFNGLTEKEKKYAHFLANACNNGSLIVLLQTSPESPAIFMLLQRLFTEEDIVDLKLGAMRACSSLSEEDFQALLTYAAGFYCNMGNYKSFGDTKIIPALSKKMFQSIVWSSAAFRKHPVLMEPLWNECCEAIYNLNPRRQELGLGKKGLSTYYSSNITEDDVALVQDFMQEKKLSPYNTRVFKSQAESKTEFTLRLASVALTEDSCGQGDTVFPLLGKSSFGGCDIIVARGDYSVLLKRVVHNLNQAKEFASNNNEVQMIEHYVHSFTTGSIDSHKNGSRCWIKNQGPIVETYIGFIESYRDPCGVRGEFEGFVSMVNKEMTVKFSNLVLNAQSFLKLLPWPSDYEKDVFLKPDFTSLDVLVCAGSGIPAGINIPNYDDIRQNEGFKNVSLGNVLQAHSADQLVTFLSQENQDLFSKYKAPSFEVQVGLHELLGHGSGKLFRKNKDGSFNFHLQTLKHLETNEPLDSWYCDGETYDTKFRSMASTYEECRAECVGLHLCLNKDILKIFGFEGDQGEDIIYVNWLNMVRAGLLGLEYYSPETASWKQAHMNARYVILRVLLEAEEGLVQIYQTTGSDGNADLLIELDRSKIQTVGRDAISKFLRKLQLYKATADARKAQEMYTGYSQVDDDMLLLRVVVLARKQPRRMFVQCNTEIKDGAVELLEYPVNASGLIQSVTRRFPFHDDEIEQLWMADRQFHTY